MNRATAVRTTTRAIRLARRAADNGHPAIARRAWLLACFTASKCGGLSGTVEGRNFILIDLPGKPNYVAYTPVEF